MNKETSSPAAPFLEWHLNGGYVDLHEAYIAGADDGLVIAFIQKSHSYCDRGHWAANISPGTLGIDGQDGFPRYYMRLDIAKQEISEFLNWRINKVRSPREDIELTTADREMVEMMIALFDSRKEGEIFDITVKLIKE